jgi:hypothetical protein
MSPRHPSLPHLRPPPGGGRPSTPCAGAWSSAARPSATRPSATRPSATRSLAALLALLGAGCGPAPSAHGPAAGLVPLAGTEGFPDPDGRPLYHDFGEVPLGAAVEHRFEFRNTDPRPLSILRLASSCSCTVPSLGAVAPDGTATAGDPFDPQRLLEVPAGGRAWITLRVDPSAVQVPNTDKLVTVRVVTDSPLTPFLALEAHLIPVAPFQVTPKEGDLGAVPQGLGGVLDLAIVQAGERGLRLGEVLELPAGFDARLGEDPRLPGRAWVLSLRVEAGHEPGYLGGAVRIATVAPDGSAAEELIVQARAQVVADLGVSPVALVLRPGAEGGFEHSVELRSRIPGQRFLVEELRVSGPARDVVTAQATPLEPDPEGRSGRWILTARAAADVDRGALDGSLSVRTDLPRSAPLEVPLSSLKLP